MPVSIYGASATKASGVYTIPSNQNVQVYTAQAYTILQEFKRDANKERVLERLRTLRELMTTVVDQSRAIG